MTVGGIQDSSALDPSLWKPAGGAGKRTDEGDPSAKEGAKEDREVKELKETDRNVRAHEAAHLAAAGALAKGGATYSYTTGPDGKRYAVAGEVRIDTSAVSGNPQATILKMQQVERAALAPADPSGQDRAVAAEAEATAAKARAELAKEHAAKPRAASDPRLARYRNHQGSSILGKLFL